MTSVPHKAKMALAADEGSTLILTILYLALALAVIAVGASATSLYLERSQLFSVADGAALAAAEAYELGDSIVIDDHVDVGLTNGQVAATVDEYLSATHTSQFEALTVVQAVSRDNSSAVVTLRSTWRAPLAGEFFPLELPVEVTVVARSVFD